MFGIGGKQRARVVAILDIGSSSVGCAFVSVRHNEPSIILASTRSFLPPATRSPDQLISGLSSIVKNIGTTLLASYASKSQAVHGSPRDLYCIVRSPWTQSHTVRVVQTFEKPRGIHDALISDMAKKALSDASVDRATLLEASVSQIELNGYPIRKADGKIAQEVAVAVLISSIDQAFRQEIDTAVHATFVGLEPKWRSHTRAALSTLGDLPQGIRDHVLIDVSGENTSLVVVRKNVIDVQGQAPEGVRKILQRVAPGKPEEETLSLIHMLERDACSGTACDAIRAAMGAAEPEIVHAFGEVFETLSTTRKLPQYAILLTHTDLADWLTKILGRIDFAPFTATGLPFHVTTLGGTDLGHWVVPDTGIATADARRAGGDR